MKDFFKKFGIITLAAVIGFSMAACNNDAADDNGGTPPDVPTPDVLTRNITVNMQKPSGWTDLYVYAWDDSGTEYSGSAPGTQLTTETSGFYSYNVPSAEYGYINVRYSNGSGISTRDIQAVESDTYFKQSEKAGSDASKINVLSSTNTQFSVPAFIGTPTVTTISLNWTPIPDADAYVLYDEVTSWGDCDTDDPSDDWERTYWHLQKALPREQTSLLDDNYGEYLTAETPYRWKLVAVKWNENVNFAGIAGKLGEVLEKDEISEMDEVKFSANYTVIHAFDVITVTTLEGDLPAPTGLQVLTEELLPTSVALKWNPVTGADYYMVWWYNNGGDGREEGWYYIESAFDTSYIDDNDTFIFPNSTYKYLIEARADDHGSGPQYGKWSDKISVTTPAAPSSSIGAYHSASSIARAAAGTKQSIPAPGTPSLTVSAKGVVTVSITGSSTQNRKFEIYRYGGNGGTYLDSVSGKKATLTKEIKNLLAGSTATLMIKEIAQGSGSSYKYPTASYTNSDFSQPASIVVPPKLNVFINKTGTTGSGSSTVKSFSITVSGWPTGAAAHAYTIKASSGNPLGTWSGDTYTGTIKTSSKISFTITPYIDGKAQTALKTGQI